MFEKHEAATGLPEWDFPAHDEVSQRSRCAMEFFRRLLNVEKNRGGQVLPPLFPEQSINVSAQDL